MPDKEDPRLDRVTRALIDARYEPDDPPPNLDPLWISHRKQEAREFLAMLEAALVPEGLPVERERAAVKRLLRAVGDLLVHPAIQPQWADSPAVVAVSRAMKSVFDILAGDKHAAG